MRIRRSRRGDWSHSSEFNTCAGRWKIRLIHIIIKVNDGRNDSVTGWLGPGGSCTSTFCKLWLSLIPHFFRRCIGKRIRGWTESSVYWICLMGLLVLFHFCHNDHEMRILCACYKLFGNRRELWGGFLSGAAKSRQIGRMTRPQIAEEVFFHLLKKHW